MDDEIKHVEEHAKGRKKRVNKVAALVGAYATLNLCKEPRHTSAYTGCIWVRDVLDGNSSRCYNMFRMERDVFLSLVEQLQQHGLKETKNIGIHESVAMFLHTVGHALSSRMQQERFQHSGETISRHFHNVLMACCRLAMSNIKPKDPTFRHVHTKIRFGKYWPFFKHAIGAIDGTHVSCVVSATDQTKFISRKGTVSQNVMAVCDWDMCFTFVLAGWEGSAHDARIFDHALTTPSMNFPHPPEGIFLFPIFFLYLA